MQRCGWRSAFVALAWGVAALLQAAAAQAINVGDKAPAFSLASTSGKPLGAKDFPGKALVLFFYAGAFTNT
jgi:glycerol uptake facilitator-like aquaporin